MLNRKVAGINYSKPSGECGVENDVWREKVIKREKCFYSS